MQEVNLYIATSIKGPAKQDGQACYILEHAQSRRTVKRVAPIHKVGDKAAEVIILKAALERIKEPCALHLYVETYYVGWVIESGRLDKWEKLDWKNSKGQQLANKEEWIRIKELLGMHEVHVHCQEHHSFTEWMQFTLNKSHKAES